MYLVPEEVELKDAIAFAYSSRFSIAQNADVEEGGEENTVVAE